MTEQSSTIPRWEWRTFGDGFADVEARIEALPHETKSSRDTYIVSGRSHANVKLRAGLLDVKRLQDTVDGMQLWRPVMKAVFPIGGEELRAVFAHWDVAMPRLTHPSYSAERLLTELVAPCADLRVVHVAKDRRAAVIDGCTVEVARLDIDAHQVRTVAVESADRDRAASLVRTLGFLPAQNTDYIVALKQTLGIDAAHLAGAREGASS